jgi:hypothetical protein
MLLLLLLLLCHYRHSHPPNYNDHSQKIRYLMFSNRVIRLSRCANVIAGLIVICDYWLNSVDNAVFKQWCKNSRGLTTKWQLGICLGPRVCHDLQAKKERPCNRNAKLPDISKLIATQSLDLRRGGGGGGGGGPMEIQHVVIFLNGSPPRLKKKKTGG